MTDVIKFYHTPRLHHNTPTGIVRSVPPVHLITTLEARALRTAPAPTPMTKLPQKEEHKKLLAKVVGFDAGALLETSKHHHHAGIQSPRHGRSMRELTPKPDNTEVEVRGQAFSGTPRLLRGGNSKSYGVRRQISPDNQLELSPDNTAPPATADSWQVTADFVLTSEPLRSSRRVAVTNKLLEKERRRDAPWVYCFKIKRDRLRMSNLIVTSTSPVDNLYPAPL
ncbi:uncharacterized protein LOC120343117 [Styela clava]